MRVGLPTCFPLSFRRRLCIHCPKYSELHSMGQISHDKLVVAQQVDKLLVLCNTKVHYRVYKNPLPVPNLIHMSPFHALQSCFFEIGFVTLPSKSRSTKCSLFAKLSRQNPASVFFSATHLFLLDSPELKYLLGLQIMKLLVMHYTSTCFQVFTIELKYLSSLSTILSNTLSICCSINGGTSFHIHTKQQAKLFFPVF